MVFALEDDKRKLTMKIKRGLLIFFLFLLVIPFSFAYSKTLTDYIFADTGDAQINNSIIKSPVNLSAVTTQGWVHTFGGTDYSYREGYAGFGNQSIHCEGEAEDAYNFKQALDNVTLRIVFLDNSADESGTFQFQTRDLAGNNLDAIIGVSTGVSATNYYYYIGANTDSGVARRDGGVNFTWEVGAGHVYVALYIDETKIANDTTTDSLGGFKTYCDNGIPNIAIDNIYLWNGSIKDRPTGIVADTTDPIIALDYPDNISIKTDLWINGTASDETALNNIFTNSSIFSTNTGTNEEWIFANPAAPDGVYNINITANDTSGNMVSVFANFTIDTTDPILTITTPTNNSVYDKVFENISYSVSCSDANPYLLNITMLNESMKEEFSVQDDSAPLSLTGKIDISKKAVGTYYINYSCSDSHTLNIIPDYDFSIDTSSKKTSFITDSASIDIQLISITKPFDVRMSVNKLTDRYLFNFGKSQERLTATFSLKSSERINYLKDSNYDAHFVTGKNWIDFENSDKYAEYKVSRISDFEYNVQVTTDDFDFLSVGGLNVVDKFHIVVINETTSVNVTLSSPANNSLLTSYEDDFTFLIDLASNCSLWINGTLNRSMTSSIGSNTFSSVVSGNGSYYWNVDCLNPNGLYGNSTEFNYQKLIIGLSPEYEPFEYNTCVFSSDGNLMSVLGLMFFFVISIAVMIFGKVLHHGIMGFVGAMMSLVCSLYIWSCISLIALCMSLLSLYLGYYFIDRAYKGEL